MPIGRAGLHPPVRELLENGKRRNMDIANFTNKIMGMTIRLLSYLINCVLKDQSSICLNI